jgi:hypothetical protein
MRVKAAQKGLAFPITESTANSRPYLKRVTNVLDRFTPTLGSKLPIWEALGLFIGVKL